MNTLNWHFQTPAMTRSESIKSSRLRGGENQRTGQRRRRREERNGGDRCDSHWVLCPDVWGKAEEGKEKKNEEEKIERDRKEQQSCPRSVFNLNPKSTGLFKNERLGSSSALCHFRKMIFISCSVARCKVLFLPWQRKSALPCPIILDLEYDLIRTQ